jgi:hypothetical protein
VNEDRASVLRAGEADQELRVGRQHSAPSRWFRRGVAEEVCLARRGVTGGGKSAHGAPVTTVARGRTPRMRSASWLVLFLSVAAIGCTEDDEPSAPSSEPGAKTIDGVPLDAAALHEYLRGGAYKQWAGESTPHLSTGPHGGKVRTFVSPGLLTSLQQASAHPKDATAIKELYGSGDSVTGWAVGIKLASDSDGGKAWYWYEVFSTQPGASPAFSGQGLALCSNCHRDGRDYVLTPIPLQ